MPSITMSKIEDAVAKKLLLRAKVGEKKYGTTMERNDLSLAEWLIHLQEELLDAAVYVEKLKQEIQYTDEVDPEMSVYGVQRGPCSSHATQQEEDECDGTLGSHPLCCTDYCPCKEDEIHKRMNIIGQNGNDGLHYGELDDSSDYTIDSTMGYQDNQKLNISDYPESNIKVEYEWVTSTNEKKERKQ